MFSDFTHFFFRPKVGCLWLLRVLSAYNRTQLTPHVDKADFCVRERNWDEKNSARNTGTNTHTHTHTPSCTHSCASETKSSQSHTHCQVELLRSKFVKKKDFVKVKKNIGSKQKCIHYKTLNIEWTKFCFQFDFLCSSHFRYFDVDSRRYFSRKLISK